MNRVFNCVDNLKNPWRERRCAPGICRPRQFVASKTALLQRSGSVTAHTCTPRNRGRAQDLEIYNSKKKVEGGCALVARLLDVSSHDRRPHVTTV